MGSALERHAAGRDLPAIQERARELGRRCPRICPGFAWPRPHRRRPGSSRGINMRGIRSRNQVA